MPGGTAKDAFAGREIRVCLSSLSLRARVCRCGGHAGFDPALTMATRARLVGPVADLDQYLLFKDTVEYLYGRFADGLKYIGKGGICMLQEQSSNDKVSKKTLKLVIADDHKLLADAVASTLAKNGEFDVSSCYNLESLLITLGQETFDVVLLDLRMPGMAGLDSVTQVIRAAGDGYVVLFTGQVDHHFLDKALSLGARGLISKTMPLRSLARIVELISSGQVFVPVGSDFPGSSNEVAHSHDLNDKEIYVLRLAADGMTNKEIARDMGATEVIVKMHMRAICKKLGARNRAHAAMISRELSLL